jgi:hypothetical protein
VSRTYEESCELLDEIVGRCVRDADFAEAVLDDPERALRDYLLNPHELEDFVALKTRHRKEAATAWRAIRSAMATIRRRGS